MGAHQLDKMERRNQGDLKAKRNIELGSLIVLKALSDNKAKESCKNEGRK